jgi:hypothetical protein
MTRRFTDKEKDEGPLSPGLIADPGPPGLIRDPEPPSTGDTWLDTHMMRIVQAKNMACTRLNRGISESEAIALTCGYTVAVMAEQDEKHGK